MGCVDMQEDLAKMDQAGPSNEPHFSLISQSYVSRESDRGRVYVQVQVPTACRPTFATDGDESSALALRQGGAIVATGQGKHFLAAL
jgi:hypothetical protein